MKHKKTKRVIGLGEWQRSRSTVKRAGPLSKSEPAIAGLQKDNSTPATRSHSDKIELATGFVLARFAWNDGHCAVHFLKKRDAYAYRKTMPSWRGEISGSLLQAFIWRSRQAARQWFARQHRDAFRHDSFEVLNLATINAPALAQC